MKVLPEDGPMSSIALSCSKCDKVKVGDSFVCSECDMDCCDACVGVLVVETLKWSWHGTKGKKPEKSESYAGLIVYHPGTFKWKENLRPGYSIIMNVKTLQFDDKAGLGKDVPHKVLC